MKNKYLEIGKIVSTHGVRGELRVQLWCDGVDYARQFKTLHLSPSDGDRVELLQVRDHGTVAIFKLAGVDSIEKAQALRGKVLWCDRNDAPEPPDGWYIRDLIGCRVVDFDDESTVYGVLTDAFQTGANDVWTIKNGEKEYLIPVIDDVVKEVDVDSEIIRITPMKGLFD